VKKTNREIKIYPFLNKKITALKILKLSSYPIILIFTIGKNIAIRKKIIPLNIKKKSLSSIWLWYLYKILPHFAHTATSFLLSSFFRFGVLQWGQIIIFSKSFISGIIANLKVMTKSEVRTCSNHLCCE